MSIKNYKEVTCDSCGNAINHFGDTSTKIANEILKEDGVIIKGRKHYCDEECSKKKAVQE